MSDESIEVSVVVPTYNQADMLERLLASFEELDYPGPFEIIIVDDCSPDRTPEVAKAWAEQEHRFAARYVRLDRNSGPGRARNEGARAARAPIVAYTDTDCVVTPSWLRMLVRKVDAESKVAGVGGKVLALSEASMAARYCVFHEILEPPYHTQYLVTCNCCYLREPLLACGGFEADIPTPGGEDVAASIRLWKEGWRFVYDADALIYHDYNASIRSFMKTWKNYGYGCGLVAGRMLHLYELYPEWGRLDIDDYWDGSAIRPTVTGIRSFYRTLFYHIGECREAGLSFTRTLEVLFMWLVERVAYLWGWRRGRAQAKREKASGL